VFLPAAALHRAQRKTPADFEVFLPAGATRCTDGVKFGTQEWNFLYVKFHPHWYKDKGIARAPKTETFTKISLNFGI